MTKAQSIVDHREASTAAAGTAGKCFSILVCRLLVVLVNAGQYLLYCWTQRGATATASIAGQCLLPALLPFRCFPLVLTHRCTTKVLLFDDGDYNDDGMRNVELID